jgi:LacI family transcriptional regulator
MNGSKNKKKITVKDIAKEAGVSICTVSHVLNKTHFVSPELTERVNNAINKYNYRMNLVASSLRKRSSKLIGIILPDSTNQLFAILTKEIERYSSVYNYNIVICNSDYNYKNDLEHIMMLYSRNADGIIMISSSEDKEVYKEVANLNIPVVLVERKREQLEFDSVTTDSYGSMIGVMDYLVKLGHKRIAFISRENNLFHGIMRFEGYIKGLKKHNLKYDENYTFNDHGLSFKDGYEAMEKLLKLKVKPTAIIAYNDVIAIGVMRAIKENNFKIPEDFSVISFDNIEIDSYLYVTLTSVGIDIKKIAESSFKLLKEKILKRRMKVKNIVIPAELHIRESTCSIK